MEPVLREVGLREVLVSVSGWHRRQVCVSGLSLGLGVHVQQGCCEHKPFWGLHCCSAPLRHRELHLLPCRGPVWRGGPSWEGVRYPVGLIPAALCHCCAHPACPEVCQDDLPGALGPCVNNWGFPSVLGPVLLPSPLHAVPGGHPATVALVALVSGQGSSSEWLARARCTVPQHPGNPPGQRSHPGVLATGSRAAIPPSPLLLQGCSRQRPAC